MILQKIKAVLIFILNLVKRSLCCLRRRRKSSADIVPLTDIGVVPNYQGQQNTQTQDDFVNWNTWDDQKPKAPQTIEEHIQFYRNQRMKKPVEQTEEEQQVDFFQGMTPTIKKQTKVVLRPKEPQTNRLAFNPTSEVVDPEDSGELKSWEEAENREGDWAEPGNWNMDEILRAKRKEEIKRKVLEKDHLRRGTAA